MYTTIYRSWYAQKKPSPRLLQPAALLLRSADVHQIRGNDVRGKEVSRRAHLEGSYCASAELRMANHTARTRIVPWDEYFTAFPIKFCKIKLINSSSL